DVGLAVAVVQVIEVRDALAHQRVNGLSERSVVHGLACFVEGTMTPGGNQGGGGDNGAKTLRKIVRNRVRVPHRALLNQGRYVNVTKRTSKLNGGSATRQSLVFGDCDSERCRGATKVAG